MQRHDRITVISLLGGDHFTHRDTTKFPAFSIYVGVGNETAETIFQNDLKFGENISNKFYKANRGCVRPRKFIVIHNLNFLYLQVIRACFFGFFGENGHDKVTLVMTCIYLINCFEQPVFPPPSACIAGRGSWALYYL